MYSKAMKATMTDLHRRTAKVMGSVIHAQETVEITENGNVVAKIVPQKKSNPSNSHYVGQVSGLPYIMRIAGNPKAALAILLEMGKVGPSPALAPEKRHSA